MPQHYSHSPAVQRSQDNQPYDRILTAHTRYAKTWPHGYQCAIEPEGIVMEDATAFKEIEAIKRLKARYCRNLDTKDWNSWRMLFTDDFLSDTTDGGGTVIEGADQFVSFTRKNIGKPSQSTAHQVHAPEIDLTSPSTAQGIWALQDVVHLAPGLTLVGYGHYHETYLKTNGKWQIKSSKLTRLREDLVTPVFAVRISDRLKKAAARAGRRRTEQPAPSSAES